MQLPFTVDQFLNVFAQYNLALWPAQLATYPLGLVMAGLTWSKRTWASPVVAACLALIWLVNGVLYHWAFFSAINPAAWGFGALFVLGALGFVWAGVVRRDLVFTGRGDLYGLGGAFFMVYALIIYPSLGAWQGHGWPYAPLFGLAPCPTTIFTWGLLLWTRAPVPRYLLIAPGLWSLIGFSAAVMLGIREDVMLLVAALATVYLLWRRDLAAGGRPSPN